MKPLDLPKKAEKAAPAQDEPVGADAHIGPLAPEAPIDFSDVAIEPLFTDFVDFETFSKSDFRAVKVLECEAVSFENRIGIAPCPARRSKAPGSSGDPGADRVV